MMITIDLQTSINDKIRCMKDYGKREFLIRSNIIRLTGLRMDFIHVTQMMNGVT